MSGTNSTGTAAKSNEGSIRSLPVASTHRMVAGQAVADLASAVKELVDNSLDAGARSVSVRLISYGENAPGVDEIEVSGGFCCMIHMMSLFVANPEINIADSLIAPPRV
jgi:hypothetical protein